MSNILISNSLSFFIISISICFKFSTLFCKASQLTSNFFNVSFVLFYFNLISSSLLFNFTSNFSRFLYFSFEIIFSAFNSLVFFKVSCYISSASFNLFLDSFCVFSFEAKFLFFISKSFSNICNFLIFLSFSIFSFSMSFLSLSFCF
jgi:hypothetical protein